MPNRFCPGFRGFFGSSWMEISFAIGFPLLAITISSPFAARSTRLESWVLASYKFICVLATIALLSVTTALIVRLVSLIGQVGQPPGSCKWRDPAAARTASIEEEP